MIIKKIMTAKCPHCHKPLYTSGSPDYVYVRLVLD